jgi:hypothetical protein
MLLETLYQKPWILILLLLVIAIWELIWKGLGLWKSAQKKQLSWFIVILIFNTVGILPIIYLLINRSKKKVVKETEKKTTKEPVKKKKSTK